MMNRKTLSLCLTIPAILLGLVFSISALTSVNLVRISKDYLVRSNHYVTRHLKSRDTQPVSPEELNLTTSISPTQAVWEMLAEVDRDRAEEDLRRLTGEEPLCISAGCYTITHRLTGSEELSRAMDYLYENLVTLDYTVEFQDWSRSGSTDRNLIARKTGVLTPTEEIYLVAHVDGVKESAQPYPAADDNASSVVNGLELARVFNDRSFGRTIVLLFSTGEEQGARGVRGYLNHLSPAELAAIKYAINRDMTGYDGNGDGLVNLAHGDHPPTLALAQVMSETIAAYQLNLDQRVVAGCP
jgi:hypothetical protein